ncbi:MAG: hypothetical protein F6K40_23600, partial [Okeania sp. SIO3I5]|nr:hypothetical protein [Okeania sp. SIO3I5]
PTFSSIFLPSAEYLPLFREPVSISCLRESSDRSNSDILNAIRSLTKRSLLEKIERQNSTLFTVKQIFQEYLLEQNLST